ncbi:4-alpha-glucanotransferase [Candidatus Woesearchaeota archaeon CG10_big_fil_rev_8_21_14_0_10_44_13]|nr:MAG: 4-alpha-glucanotransferase [Candidatus Woesearchaeota archaeon CG10_big_fil_rev_8_21_14_0_10_44_13]
MKGDRRARVLMFGWEFPPYSSGGLGTACHGLVKGLSNNGTKVIFVAPKTPKSDNSNTKLISAMSNITLKEVESMVTPYMNENEFLKELTTMPAEKISLYGKNLFQAVYLFSRRAKIIAEKEKGNYDVIHCHDWLTYQAGIYAKEVSGKPLVVHMHATEFDRTGGNGINQYVYDLEKEGLMKADKVITVSNYTKNMVVKHYGIDPKKITVVHNAVEFEQNDFPDAKINDGLKTVLFLGRVTLQKGPDYFIYAARRISDMYPNVKFIISGTGDMLPFIIQKAADLGIADKVLFTGFLKGADVDRAYQMADVYVMPSVSEPFGITPLEALKNNVPVVISKQSGVSEVLRNAFKVDFWDIDEMTNKVVSILRYDELKDELTAHGSTEVRRFSWDEPARKCMDVYENLIR